jgi:predicted dehydrogenase
LSLISFVQTKNSDVKEAIENSLDLINYKFLSNIKSNEMQARAMHRAEGHIPRTVPEWWFNKELIGGGVLIDLGIHVINLTRWYFGEIKDAKAAR